MQFSDGVFTIAATMSRGLAGLWPSYLAYALTFLPFSASVLAESLRDHASQRTAVVFYGASFALDRSKRSPSLTAADGQAEGTRTTLVQPCSRASKCW